jgi:hypothetical protein
MKGRAASSARYALKVTCLSPLEFFKLLLRLAGFPCKNSPPVLGGRMLSPWMEDSAAIVCCANLYNLLSQPWLPQG